MKTHQRAAVCLPLLVSLLLSAVPNRAIAIPYFARKYKTTCSRCHSDVPKLNSFGKNFQLHGYQQPGDKQANKIDFPEDKNLTLIDQLPVAFLIENQVQLDKAVGNQTADNIASPLVFHVFAADTIAPDIGFFGELASSDGVVSVGKAQAVFSDLGDRNIFFQVGNLDPTEHGVTEHDLFGRSGYAIQDLQLATSGGYQLSSQHMGARVYGLLGAAVTPDLIHGKSSGTDETAPPAKSGSGRPMALASPSLAQKGSKSDDLEQSADPMDELKGFLWEVGIFDSTNTNGNPNTPNPSDFEARVNAYFGGDSFIGLSAYSGLMTVGGGAASRYRMAGPDLSFWYGKPIEKSKEMYVKPFDLLAGYMVGQVDNASDAGPRANWNGIFVEQDYMPSPRSVCFLRYDKVNGTNLDALTPTFTEGLTANYTFYIRTNFWIGAEYTQDLTNAKQNLLGVLFNFAF